MGKMMRSLMAALSFVVLVSAQGVPVALAQTEPVFHLPFPCGETWAASTRANHQPSIDTVDFNLPGDMDDRGRSVLAGADGGVVTDVVTADDDAEGYGNHVRILYPGGVELLFAQLEEPSTLSRDDPVDARTVVGRVGASGDGGEPRLHYEQRILTDGRWVQRPVVIEGRTWRLIVDIADDRGDISRNPGVEHVSQNCGLGAGPAPATQQPAATLPPIATPAPDTTAGANVTPAPAVTAAPLFGPSRGPSGDPIRRPVGLPGRVPWAEGERHRIIHAYDRGSADGWGITAGGSSGEEAYPLFGGEVVYAGCGTGRSSSLGKMVVVRRNVGGRTFDAVHGHLSEIDEDIDGASPSLTVAIGPNDPIGRYGSTATDPATGSCEEGDGGRTRLYAGILRDAEVRSDGEISGGRPVYPEPLVGRGVYENFTWWNGVMTATDLRSTQGNPSGNWASRAAKDGAHIPFGNSIPLSVRVRDDAPIKEVHFTVYYPNWARERSAANADGFNPRTTWRVVAICRPRNVSGDPPITRGCRWDGDRNDAVVTYDWDPTLAEDGRVSWVPRARTAIGTATRRCVPVSLSFDIIDQSGHQHRNPAGIRRENRCRAQAGGGDGRVVYLDTLSPPAPPGNVRWNCVAPQGIKPLDTSICPDYARATLRWNDRSNNEQGFYIYARVNGVQQIGDVCFGGSLEDRSSSWIRIATLPANTTSYRARWPAIRDAVSIPDFYPWNADLRVASYNRAGESNFVGSTSIRSDEPLFACG